MSLKIRTILSTILATLVLYGCGGQSSTYKGFEDRRAGIKEDMSYLANTRLEARRATMVASFDDRWKKYLFFKGGMSRLNGQFTKEPAFTKLNADMSGIQTFIEGSVNSQLAQLQPEKGIGPFRKKINGTFGAFKKKVLGQFFKRLGDTGPESYRNRVVVLEKQLLENIIATGGNGNLDPKLLDEAYNIQIGLEKLNYWMNDQPLSASLKTQACNKSEVVDGIYGYVSFFTRNLPCVRLPNEFMRIANSYLEQVRFQLDGAQVLIEKWNDSPGMRLGRLALVDKISQVDGDITPKLTQLVKHQLVMAARIDQADSETEPKALVNASYIAIQKMNEIDAELASLFKTELASEKRKIEGELQGLTQRWYSSLNIMNVKAEDLGELEARFNQSAAYYNRLNTAGSSVSSPDRQGENFRKIKELRGKIVRLISEFKRVERMSMLYELRTKLIGQLKGNNDPYEKAYYALSSKHNAWLRAKKIYETELVQGNTQPKTIAKWRSNTIELLGAIESDVAVSLWGGHFSDWTLFDGLLFKQDLLSQGTAGFPGFDRDKYILFYNDQQNNKNNLWMRQRDNLLMNGFLQAYRTVKERMELFNVLELAKTSYDAGASDADIWRKKGGVNERLGLKTEDHIDEAKLSLKNSLNRWLTDALKSSQNSGFVDPTVSLQQAIDFALDKNLRLKLAEYEIRLASKDAITQKLRMLPDLEGNVQRTVRSQYDQTDLLNVNTGEVISSPLVSSRRGASTADISLTWDVLGTVVDYVAYNQANRKVDKLRMKKKALELDIAKRVMKAYWIVTLNQHLLQFFNGEWNELNASLNLSAGNSGFQDKYNKLRMQKRLVRLTLDIKNMEREFLVSRNNLIRLIGMDQQANFRLRVYSVDEVVQELPRPEDLSIYTLENFTLFNHPELYAQDLEIKVVHDNARKALLKMFPGFKLFAGDYYDGSDLRVNNMWNSVGASLSFNLAGFFVHNAERKAFKKQEYYEKAKRILLTASSIAKTHLSLIRYENLMSRLLLLDQSNVLACREDKLVKETIGLVKLGPNRLPFDVTLEYMGTRAKLYQAISEVFAGYFDLLATVGVPARFWLKDRKRGTKNGLFNYNDQEDSYNRSVSLYQLQEKKSGSSFVLNMYDRRMTNAILPVEEADNDPAWTSKNLENQTGLDFGKKQRRRVEEAASRFDRATGRNNACLIEGRDCNPAESSDGKMIELLRSDEIDASMDFYKDCDRLMGKGKRKKPQVTEGIAEALTPLSPNANSTAFGNDYLWKVQVGAFANPKGPARRLKQISGIGVRLLDPRDAKISYITLNEQVLTRVRFLGMPRVEAESMCAELLSKNMECWAVPPGW